MLPLKVCISGYVSLCRIETAGTTIHTGRFQEVHIHTQKPRSLAKLWCNAGAVLTLVVYLHKFNVPYIVQTVAV